MVALDGVPGELRASVSAIARRFDVPLGKVSLAPQQGQVNLTVFLGDDLVLRLPRKPAYEQRLHKEAAVIPFVQGVGVPTAELVAFDPDHAIADVSYIVLTRLPSTLHGFPADIDLARRAYGTLAELLHRLHSVQMTPDGQPPGVEWRTDLSPDLLLEPLIAAGDIGRAQEDWLRQWFTRLEEHGARTSDPVLLHGDVLPSNLIADATGRVTALIDWGSACWGEPARDLADFPTSILPLLIDAYRETAPSSPAAQARVRPVALEASVLWYQLFFALARLLGRQSISETRNWSAPRHARLFELLRFVSSAVPAQWNDLLPPS